MDRDVATGKNIRKQTPVPGLAPASPIVQGDRVYVATAVKLQNCGSRATNARPWMATMNKITPQLAPLAGAIAGSPRRVWCKAWARRSESLPALMVAQRRVCCVCGCCLGAWSVEGVAAMEDRIRIER